MIKEYERLICVFDPHGDKIDKRAAEAMFRFCDQWKPTLRIHGGDNWDFRPLRKKASEEERRESMAKDDESGRHFLERFKPNYFLRGNHDERLWELAESGKGVESDYALKAVVEIENLIKKLGCRMLPYHKKHGVLRIGHMKVLHGFYCGVYASRQHALTYGSCLFGHTHVIDQHAVPGLERRVARNAGALCDLDMDYAARKPNTLRQAHGFVYGVVNRRTGLFHVWQAEAIRGKWVIPSDIVTL